MTLSISTTRDSSIFEWWGRRSGAAPRKPITEKLTVVSYPGSWSDTMCDAVESLGDGVYVMYATSAEEAMTCPADRILLMGGADVNPRLYGQELIHAQSPDMRRDAVEFTLAQRALREGIPIMGICRGHQMLAVAAGGTLHQDLVKEDVSRDNHRNQPHRIEIYNDKLAAAVPTCRVNSYHHQAVNRTPSGFKRAAVSLDGVTEAIYRPGALGVQWHPEALWQDDRRWSKLFTWFLKGLK